MVQLGGKNVDFLLKCLDLVLKFLDFVFKMFDFCIENGRIVQGLRGAIATRGAKL